MDERFRAASRRSRCGAMIPSPLATRQRSRSREIWTGERYREFRSGAVERLPARRLRQLRIALEPVMPKSRPRVASVIPTLDEQEAIAGVVAAIPLGVVDRVIVVDSGSSDDTVARASAAGADSSARSGAVMGAPAGSARGGGRLPDRRVSGRRRQRLPGGDPASCRATCRRSRGFCDRLAHSGNA